MLQQQQPRGPASGRKAGERAARLFQARDAVPDVVPVRLALQGLQHQAEAVLVDAAAVQGRGSFHLHAREPCNIDNCLVFTMVGGQDLIPDLIR